MGKAQRAHGNEEILKKFQRERKSAAPCAECLTIAASLQKSLSASRSPNRYFYAPINTPVTPDKYGATPKKGDIVLFLAKGKA